MKSRTLKATLAFLTAASAVVGFAGTSSAASTPGQTYSFPLQAKSDADITGNASATVSADGTMIDYVVFADNVDVDEVAMHWHTGETCDAGGGIAISVPGPAPTTPTTVVRNPDETIKNGFVISGTLALGGADMENLYFNVHDASNLADVVACGELDATATPLLGTGVAASDPETRANSSAVTFGGSNAFSLNGSDVVLSGGVTLEGTKLAINLDLDGDDLLDGANRLVTLRSTSSCTVEGGDTYLLEDVIRVVTTAGTTAMPTSPAEFTDAFNNTGVAKIPGVPPVMGDPVPPASAVLDTTLILTPAEAEALGTMSIVIHGNAAQPDTSRPDGPGTLTVQELEPIACGQLGGGTDSFLNGNYYSLDFKEVGASGVSGPGYLKNTTSSAVGSIEAVMNLTVPPAITGDQKVVLDGDTSCDALAAPIGITSIAPDLLVNGADQIDVNSGVLRTFLGPVSNTGTFEGDDATLINDGLFSVLITNESKTTVLACAQLTRAFGEAPAAPPAPTESTFDGTVADATTLAEIQAASDYRSTADNRGIDQEIMRLYTAFFNRQPDVAGVQYWIAVSKGEAGPEENRRVYNTLEIAGFFVPSNEFQTTFASVPADEFVDAVYLNVLKRGGEESGVIYWNDILNGTNNSGNNEAEAMGTRAEVVYYVALNNEFVTRLPYAPPAG